MWFRSEHPDGEILTEMISHGNQEAIFQATIKIPGGGSATGWGSEDAQGFGDYIEKAETKSVGRALAALGFGTQFCNDFDFGAASGRVVDAPTQFQKQPDPQVEKREGVVRATDRQIQLISSLARDKKLSRQELDAMCVELENHDLDNLSKRGASALIETLKA